VAKSTITFNTANFFQGCLPLNVTQEIKKKLPKSLLNL
jgi:hypothetical protein